MKTASGYLEPPLLVATTYQDLFSLLFNSLGVELIVVAM
jgi:hypothetical protein